MELARINILGKNKFSISNLNSVKGILVEDTWGKQKLDSNIAKEFQIMEEILLCYVLEINCAYYIRYRNMAGSTEITMAGTPSYIPSSYSLKEEGFNISDAQCSVTYCTNTVVEVESKLDSLNKPFSL